MEETRICSRCHLPRPAAHFRSRRRFCDRCHNLHGRYKTTYQHVKELWETQGGTCALCETPISLDMDTSGDTPTANLDHCHTTNDIRGLLCRHCNLLLGHAKDRVVVLQAAIRYLRKSVDCIPERAASNEKDEDAEKDRHGDG